MANKLDNLTPFNSETGSEAGKKSKRKPLDKELQEMAESMLTEKGITYDKAIKQSLIEKAKKDLKAMDMYFDRIHGKPNQNIKANLSGIAELSKEQIISLYESLKNDNKDDS